MKTHLPLATSKATARIPSNNHYGITVADTVASGASITVQTPESQSRSFYNYRNCSTELLHMIIAKYAPKRYPNNMKSLTLDL